MIPDSARPWWRRYSEGPLIVDVAMLHGCLQYRVGTSWYPVTDDGCWICPVAPPGSVAPEEYATGVREAFLAGFNAAPGDHWRSSRVERDPASAWNQSYRREELIARVGLAVVEAVER